MPYNYGLSGINKYRFDVYIRTQAPYTAPASESDLTTLLGTGTKIGKLEDKSVELNLEPNDQVDLNDGTKKTLDWMGSVTLKDMNVSEANISELTGTYDGVDADVLLYDSNNNLLIAVKDFTAQIQESWKSGDLSALTITGEKKVSQKDQFREITATGGLV
jgi:hypothetical protein